MQLAVQIVIEYRAQNGRMG